MNKLTKIFFLILIILNFLIGSWHALNKDIYFDTDIARDFLIMDEISQKKIVLVGPRADQEGLFHGPLWHYLNYPGYLISQGDPAGVGLYWTFLTAIFIVVSFFIAKKLFDSKIAWLYALFLSFYMVPYMRGYSHPFAVLFLMPVFFYFFVAYQKSKDWKNLTISLLIAGFMTHLEIGGGAPFLVLTAVCALYNIIKGRKFSHLLAFLILVIPLFNFILFDLRHEFIQTKSILNYLSGHRKAKILSTVQLIGERLRLISYQGLNFFKNKATEWNLIPSYFMAYFLFLFTKLKKDEYRDYYMSFLYLFFGFYIISLLHGASVLIFYWISLTGITSLIFFSLVRPDNKKTLYPLFILIFIFNFFYNISSVKNSMKDFSGLHHGSWKFHNNLTKTVFTDAPNTFGYFIYAPDFYGYAEKYSLRFNQMHSLKTVTPFQKQKITYLVIEPPPEDRPGLSVDWWRKNKLKILSKPIKTISYKNRFIVEKYQLTEEEIKVAPDSDIAQWLYFR